MKSYLLFTLISITYSLYKINPEQLNEIDEYDGQYDIQYTEKYEEPNEEEYMYENDQEFDGYEEQSNEFVDSGDEYVEEAAEEYVDDEVPTKENAKRKGDAEKSHLKPFHYVFAMVMTLLGLYTNLFGSEQTKVILFLYGSTIFVLIAFAIVQSIKNAGWIAYLLSLGLGSIIGGFLFMWLEKVVSYIASIFSGYALAAVVLVFLTIPMWVKIVVGSTFVIAAVVLNYFINLFPISTSILGAFCFCTGVDLVFQWGFVELLGVYWNEKQYVSLGLVIVFLVMTIVGGVIQVLAKRNRRRGDELYEELGTKNDTSSKLPA
jgi:hypothetical protein